MDGKIFCDKDFILSGYTRNYKKCKVCSEIIIGKSLRALASIYHPECFKCNLCNKMLENEQFTVNPQNKVLCLNDFHKMYSPKCGKCQDTIYPVEKTGILVRVEAMNHDFHVDCFACEICGQHLGGEDGSQCYPLSGLFMCKKCHVGCLHQEIRDRKQGDQTLSSY